LKFGRRIHNLNPPQFVSLGRSYHVSTVLNFSLAALAHLGLARAYALSSDNGKARTAYQDFLALWKDPEPDIPILNEPKAEHGKLKC
jgi:eukaryotic-like serine/threonine-protein kinase